MLVFGGRGFPSALTARTPNEISQHECNVTSEVGPLPLLPSYLDTFHVTQSQFFLFFFMRTSRKLAFISWTLCGNMCYRIPTFPTETCKVRYVLSCGSYSILETSQIQRHVLVFELGSKVNHILMNKSLGLYYSYLRM